MRRHSSVYFLWVRVRVRVSERVRVRERERERITERARVRVSSIHCEKRKQCRTPGNSRE